MKYHTRPLRLAQNPETETSPVHPAATKAKFATENQSTNPYPVPTGR